MLISEDSKILDELYNFNSTQSPGNTKNSTHLKNMQKLKSYDNQAGKSAKSDHHIIVMKNNTNSYHKMEPLSKDDSGQNAKSRFQNSRGMSPNVKISTNIAQTKSSPSGPQINKNLHQSNKKYSYNQEKSQSPVKTREKALSGQNFKRPPTDKLNLRTKK